MQYVRSISGSVSKTWNSINPATLSGAIDVIVVEHEDGSLACSPFHVRFGKFSLLRPYEKKVEFRVNNELQDYAMKLGEGGEAFFVFETSADIPEALQTSPLVSPVASPEANPSSSTSIQPVPDLEPLDDLDGVNRKESLRSSDDTTAEPITLGSNRTRAETAAAIFSASLPESHGSTTLLESASGSLRRPSADKDLPLGLTHTRPVSSGSQYIHSSDDVPKISSTLGLDSPPMLPRKEAVTRAMTLSKKLWSSNIPSQVNDNGDLMLDMTGYKSSEEDTLRAEVIARQILSEEVEGSYDIASLIGADEKGNLWIYSSEEAKDAAARRAAFPLIQPAAMVSLDALSDPGYHSDDNRSEGSVNPAHKRDRAGSDSTGLTTPLDSPELKSAQEPSKNYAKTLRLTSEQLRALKLKPGPNPMSFSVNRATCQAYMYLWRHDVPIVISDIDGTITKSDALGHVLNMIGRDWTHAGVAKLYSEIVANGYNIFYLTSRSVGQADTTRNYISGIVQDGGYRLPRGPVIMSPDRTVAALRREIYLRKPEVFKMACLRDIMSLFHNRKSPFYAGFGNRLTDALSYRSVNIPSTRIFTINSNAEVSLDLLSLNKYKTGYTSMRETVDHFFPPTGMLVQEGGEEYTDFNYWREAPMDFEMSDSESEHDDGSHEGSDEYGSEGEDEDDDEDVLSDGMADSYLSTGRGSLEESLNSLVRQSLESNRDTSAVETRHSEEDEGDEAFEADQDDDDKAGALESGEDTEEDLSAEPESP